VIKKYYLLSVIFLNIKLVYVYIIHQDRYNDDSQIYRWQSFYLSYIVCLPVRLLLSSVDIIGKVLHENIGKSVLIKLKGRKVVTGTLLRYDQQMNLFLQDSVELLEEHGKSNNLGNILIRGDNVITVSTYSTN
jgi:small nuclear ribonucleoprotein